MKSSEIRLPIFSNIEIDIDGPQGNAYCIIGIIQNLLNQSGFKISETSKITKDMMSKNYEHLINVASNYVCIKSEIFDFEEIM